MIREAVIVTLRLDGDAHLTPLGYRLRDGQVILAPFVPSATLDNLRAHPEAVLCFTDEVRVIAGALTGRRDWPLLPAARVTVPRLAACLAHWELQVEHEQPDRLRPEFSCRIIAQATHAPFLGFNRAQAAVVELAVLVSRLDWLETAAVRAAIAHLAHAVERTAGPAEREAWDWLMSAVAAHPRHREGAV
jgi:hypothetical protein